MTFALSKILWFIVRPGNLLALLACVFAWWSVGSSGSRTAWLAAITISLLLIAGVLPIGQWLSLPLEDRFGRPESLPERLDGIIVLGGAQASDVAASRGVLATNNAAERFTEATALAKRYPEARILFTGGSGRLFPGKTNERIVNEIYADLLGLDPARTIYEDRSRNTFENALFSQRLIKPGPDQTWVLVTSARHMPRAIGIFRRIGWEVIAWPVDYRTTGKSEWPGEIAFSDRLVELDEAVREWIGLLVYWMLRRTDGLLPGPEPNQNLGKD